ncbi:MAG: glucodextranase DOMON-like domain-containing protein, partial [Candidatus Eisenbacteria bacterium]
DSREPNVPVDLKTLSGQGTISPSQILTDTNGRFQVEFSSLVAGLAVISDSAEYAGQKLTTNSVTVTVIPGPAASVKLSSQYGAVYPGLRFKIEAQITDEFGNAVRQPGVSVSLFSSPPGKLSELTTPIVTDEWGLAAGFATAAPSCGTLEIAGSSPFAVSPVTISIEADLIAVDEPAPETDPRHHSISGMDLTGLYVRLEGDTVRINVPFRSDWDATHIGVILETKNDADGLLSDAFRFPVVFEHPLRPDFIFTDKFRTNSDGDAANDYADFRRWAGPGVDSFWDLVAEVWTTDGANPNKNAASWTRHDGTGLQLAIPASVVGVSTGSEIRVQAYCMDESGTKRTAFDSCPHDSTHNMVGNWWETSGDTVRLHYYASATLTPLPLAPLITGFTISSFAGPTGEMVLLAASLTAREGGIGDVTVDLSPVLGSAVQALYDDGTHGDVTAGDLVFSYAFGVTAATPGGVHVLTVTARDASNRSKATTSGVLEIAGETVVLRTFDDAVGDDHGPNRYGQPGLYYTYPTNPVFFPGSFDLKRVEVIDEGDWIDFRILVGDITSPDEPNAPDWNAFYPSPTTCRIPERVDFNLQNLAVFIDSEKGGATTALPNRYADIGRWDAWEYALVAEGWWKGLLVSNGSSDPYSWTKNKADTDFWFCTNHVENSVDMHVRKGLLGNPSADDIRRWDIIVTMCSHDGNSTDENFGAVRWVNEGSSSEWQFGGGRNGESGRERDANIIDVAASAGLGKLPGVSQDTMLDYTTRAANDRFNAGLVAVAPEASRFEDYAPPAIRGLPTDGMAITQWFAMKNAPLVIGTTITDDDEVAEASLRWRPLRGTFSEPLRMSRLLEDLWATDIELSTLTSAVNPVEGKLYFEVQLSAKDRSGNSAESRIFTVEADTLQVEEHVLADIGQYDDPLAATFVLQGVPGVIPDGSSFVIPDTVLRDPNKAYDLVFTSLGTVDVSQLSRETGPFIGVARRFTILERDTGEAAGTGEPLSQFTSPLSFHVHYPSYAARGRDTRGFAVYRWQDEASRWILLGGNAVSLPGLVSIETQDGGTYGIFADRFSFDSNKNLSSILISPNPFSPNGDGLYENTRVSFFLQRRASVLIEIYDMAGQLVRRYPRKSFEQTGRIEGLVWDGKDSEGRVVPYGIYIIRIESIEPQYSDRAERFNKAVVVIK